MSLRPPSQYRNRVDPRETWSFFVDGRPVELKGPVATVQQILEAAGISPSAVQVRRIWSPEDPSGKPMGAADSVSAFPEGQVHLRTFPVSADPVPLPEPPAPPMEPATVVEETLVAEPVPAAPEPVAVEPVAAEATGPEPAPVAQETAVDAEVLADAEPPATSETMKADPGTVPVELA